MGQSTLTAARREKALLLAGSLANAWPTAKRAPESLAAPKQHDSFAAIDYRRCVICRALFIGRPTDGGHRKTCSTPCATEHRRQIGNARKRNREHAERAAVSDITNEQELAMRRKARTCPICGSRLTSEPGLPNSKHLDHIVPLGIGGTHTLGNVRVTCAACNVRRPKDGSDYFGPVTLWAMLPGTVARPHGLVNKTTCRKGLHPWTPDNIEIRDGRKRCVACRNASGAERKRRNRKRPTVECKCGTQFAAAGSARTCTACLNATARRAADMHAGGMSWTTIAEALGYASYQGIRDLAASRADYKPERRTARVKAKPRCKCGAEAWRSARCQPCIGAAAQRAVHLRTEGWTLRMIADELGYSSITAVTNLLKTLVEIEPVMGRPSSNRT